MTTCRSFVDIPTITVLVQSTVFHGYKFFPDRFPSVFSVFESKREKEFINYKYNVADGKLSLTSKRCARGMCKQNIHEKSNFWKSKFQHFSCHEFETSFLQLIILSINDLQALSQNYEKHSFTKKYPRSSHQLVKNKCPNFSKLIGISLTVYAPYEIAFHFLISSLWQQNRH